MISVRRKVYGVPRDEHFRRTPYSVRRTHKEKKC